MKPTGRSRALATPRQRVVRALERPDMHEREWPVVSHAAG